MAVHAIESASSTSAAVLTDSRTTDPLIKRAMNRGRGTNYIGNEHEWDRMIGSRANEQYMRLVHPPRLRGPSER